MSVNNPADSTPAAGSGSDSTGETNGSAETVSDGSASYPRPNSTVKAGIPPGTPKETQGDSVVSPLGDTSRRRGVGRAPGPRAKNSGTAASKAAKAEESKYVLTREEAEIGWKFWKSTVVPQYNAGFGFWGRPFLTPDELENQHNAYIDFAMLYGDPMGKFGPPIMLIASLTMPVIVRVMPVQLGGLRNPAVEAAE